MAEPNDPVTETDLDAYVDDQLDRVRRIEVETHLSTRPELAARVMADLCIRDEMRLALAGPLAEGRTATTDAARRLGRAMARDRLVTALRRAAVVVLLVGAGWLAHAGLGPLSVRGVVASTPPPAFVQEALTAHRTTMLRAAMISQPEVPFYDPDEVRAATAIVMPELPPDWRIRDVQIYPSDFGPSVEMAIETEDLGLVSLFAVRPGSFDVVEPTGVDFGETASAYFQIGEVAYALVTNSTGLDLARAAEGLASTLY
jgi:anti-sigma factor RsiW